MNIEALEIALQAETKRRVEAEQRLHRAVFAMSGEALSGEDIDKWLSEITQNRRAQAG